MRNKNKLENKNCVTCGSEFKTNKSWQKYCSKKCRDTFAAIKRKNNKIKTETKICIICGKEFLPRAHNQKTCSKDCHIQNGKNLNKINKIKNKKELIRICVICKRQFKPNASMQKICSRECRIKLTRKISKQEKIVCRQKLYEETNKDKRREYYRERYHIRKNNLEYKLKKYISNSIRGKLKRKKDFTTFNFLDYAPIDLKNYLESLFKDSMSWDNYGKYGWHIDHIKPVAAFKLIKEDGELDLEQIKLCWSLDNLQPLWAKENLTKKSWYEVDGKMCRFSNGEIVEIREDNT